MAAYVPVLAGSEPFLATPVIYDVSVKSDGCYKAEAPPSFIGAQLMTNAHGHSIVNPLYVIYGCFDTTGATVKCTEGSNCGPTKSTSGTGTGTSNHKAPTAAREAERRALQKPTRRSRTRSRQITERHCHSPEMGTAQMRSPRGSVFSPE